MIRPKTRELKDMDDITFAIRVLQERTAKLSPTSYLGIKLSNAINALTEVKQQKDENERSCESSDVTDFSECDDETKAQILENDKRLKEKYPESGESNAAPPEEAEEFYGKRFDQDKAAHQIFAFAMDARNELPSVKEKCRHCGGNIQTHYCEKRLYTVRCLNCGISALAQASSPSEAAQKTIGELVSWQT